MNSIKNIVKTFLKKFSERFSNVEEIENDEGYNRVKKWVKKTQKSYKKSTFFMVLLSCIFAIVISNLLKKFNGWGFLGYVLPLIFLPIYVLVGWGLTTVKMHFKEVAKSAWKAARYGYQIGETIKTTHVNVSHEFGNSYKVTSTTEDKGILFACIGMMCILGTWATYCTYKGSFLTFKKIKASKIKIEEYHTRYKV